MQTERMENADCFTTLMDAAYHIQHGHREVARRGLAAMLDATPEHLTCADNIQARLFAIALMKSCGGSKTVDEGIYTRDYANRQIDLFNLITKSFPIVSLSKRMANETLFAHAQGEKDLTLIDIGIGSGFQILELLILWRERGELPRKLTIVGIEPDGKSLAHAEQILTNWQADKETEFRFVALPHCIEDLSPAQWQEIAGLGGEIVINEAYSLHHIRPDGQGNDRKNLILRRLFDLKPKVFVLTEPHSDHENGSLFSRFHSAWGHYGLAFRLVDRLPIDADAKHAIKLLFFGREIEDVLANSEEKRSERHELADMWINRLVNSGFIPSRVPVPRDLEQGVVVVSGKDLYVSLECERRTIVAIMAVTVPPCHKC